MFTVEGVVTARNPSEATARYWLMRGSQSLSPEQEQFEAELYNAADGVRSTSEGIIAMRNKLEANREHNKITTLALARLCVYQALYINCLTELSGEDAAWGVRYRTDYRPLGDMAEILEGQDKGVVGSFPIKTETVTYPDFIYVAEQDKPFTVIRGDFSEAQAHIMEARNVAASTVVVLA